MPHQEFEDNLKQFSDLINQLRTSHSEHEVLIKRYIEQNLIILNEVFAISIDSLKKIQKVKTANDIICMQARFTNEVSKQLTLSAQRFLNASLGHISDYNEWLKAHCDLATD